MTNPDLLSVPDLTNYVSADALANHRDRVDILEEELDAKRRCCQEAHSKIIWLHAAITAIWQLSSRNTC